jgi:phospholipid/cholesterol/gamma-HCH transport system ATP-binding protein
VARDSQDLLLTIEGLRKGFDEQVVLADVSLAVPRGRLVTVLGRSGAGKSVLLKCLANVIEPDGGAITFDGRPLTSGDAATRADFRRRCSFLFQSNALFDSLTALENVALPLEQTTGLSRSEIRERSMEALNQLELDAHSHQHPGQLSGGMQKRLALARAIVTKPELVLFDEPTAGLDPLRRNAVFTMIARYQRQFHFTALIVTHDVPEALVASDRVALLDKGHMCFEGTPTEFTASADPVVADFRDSEQALGSALASIRQGAIPSSEES